MRSVASVMSNSLWPTRLFCTWYSSGENTGVGCHALLPTQDLNPCLLHCRCILYPLSHLDHACCHLIDVFFLLKCPDVQLNKWISFFLLPSFLLPFFFSLPTFLYTFLNLGIGFNKYTCIFFSLKRKYCVLGVGGDGFCVYSVLSILSNIPRLAGLLHSGGCKQGGCSVREVVFRWSTLLVPSPGPFLWGATERNTHLISLPNLHA